MKKAAGCATEAFSTTCAVHIEDCEGWWLSGCRGSVAEHWRLKPEVSWFRLPVAAGLFHLPLFSPHNIQIHLLKLVYGLSVVPMLYWAHVLHAGESLAKSKTSWRHLIITLPSKLAGHLNLFESCSPAQAKNRNV